LALLGSGGERTDVGAHLFGLVAGVGIGAVLSTWLKTHPVPDPTQQRILGASAIVLPIIAWMWGFYAKL
jgi:hypothetical protein